MATTPPSTPPSSTPATEMLATHTTGTQRTSRNTIMELAYAIDNYRKHHLSNQIEVIVSREFAVYEKHKKRMKKQATRQKYLSAIASIIAEATRSSFTVIDLKESFNRLRRQERSRKKRKRKRQSKAHSNDEGEIEAGAATASSHRLEVSEQPQ